ncbi:hypothetical protein RFI_21480, partial [Reticulomyxa filosa]
REKSIKRKKKNLEMRISALLKEKVVLYNDDINFFCGAGQLALQPNDSNANNKILYRRQMSSILCLNIKYLCCDESRRRELLSLILEIEILSASRHYKDWSYSSNWTKRKHNIKTTIFIPKSICETVSFGVSYASSYFAQRKAVSNAVSAQKREAIQIESLQNTTNFSGRAVKTTVRARKTTMEGETVWQKETFSVKEKINLLFTWKYHR